MAKLNVKKGDTVLVIAGKDNGKTAEILECFPEENKVTVKGINVLVKHKKPKSAQDKGGIVKLEGKIPASNVMVVCPTCNKATKVKVAVDEKGNKTRVCKKCGALLDGAKKPAKKEAAVKAESAKKATAKAEPAKKTTVKAEEKKTEPAKKTTKATATKTATTKKVAKPAEKAEAKKTGKK